MKDEASAVASDDAVLSRSRNVIWYEKELKPVPPSAREVLEKYSKIPADKVDEHVYAIRERAWEVFPYPCIGGWRFLDLNLCTTKPYQHILDRVKNGEKLLDFGCCFGQELRKLILDGAPQENLVGVDLRQEFFELGHELFLDRETCKVRFIAADAFKPSQELDDLNGTTSIAYTGSFFHLFDRPEQLKVALRTISLLADKPGVMVLGRQIGNVNAGRYEHNTNESGCMFRHNEQSWKELWDEAGSMTGTKWDVWVELRETPRFGSGGRAEGARQMHFCVTRV